MSRLIVLPCVDSEKLAERRRRELDLPRETAAALGRSAVLAAQDGRYQTATGTVVEIGPWVQAAIAATLSLAPGAPLPAAGDFRQALLGPYCGAFREVVLPTGRRSAASWARSATRSPA